MKTPELTLDEIREIFAASSPPTDIISDALEMSNYSTYSVERIIELLEFDAPTQCWFLRGSGIYFAQRNQEIN